MEGYKDIKDYEGLYKIKKDGTVYSLYYNKVMKPKVDRYGYPVVGLYKNKKKYYPTVHRLVALTYLPNPNNYNQVNHKDGNKLNNHVSNLEWCSAKHNIVHSYVHRLNSNCVRVRVKDVTTGEIKFWPSIKSFCKSINDYLSVILPLIKHSALNPIDGRYEINLLSTLELLSTSNVKNFGLKCYVWDSIEGTYHIYPSILIASYETGIRGLSVLQNKVCRQGYIISKQPIPKNKRVLANNRADARIKRLEYLLRPNKRLK